MGASTAGLYHVNPSTGKVGKCTAKKGNCPYSQENGGLGHWESREDAVLILERYNAINTAFANALSKLRLEEDKHEDTKDTEDTEDNTPAPVQASPVNNEPVTASNEAATGDDNEDPNLDEFERIESLMSSSIPLKLERDGKVPTISPDDDSVRIQSKLAQYLWKNFDGNYDEAHMKALEHLYDGEVIKNPLPSECDYGFPDATPEQRNRIYSKLEDYRKRLEAQTGDSVDLYWQGNHAVYVSRGKKSNKTMNTNAAFRDNGIPLRVLNTGSLLAADSVVRVMEKQGNGELSPDVRGTVANALMGTNRRQVIIAQLNGTEYYSSFRSKLSAMSNSMRARGVDVSDPPSFSNWSKGVSFEQALWAAQSLEKVSRKLEDPDLPYRDRAVMQTAKVALSNHLMDARMNGLAENGTYRTAVSELLEDEQDAQANYRYVQRMKIGHSATIREYKKNRDPEHDAAGEKSSFAKNFGNIEVDDSVDLGKFSKLSDEYAAYKSLLPSSDVKPDLRFRLTGRHHATGVYSFSKNHRNMAVDPRSPSSFTHEWFHHLDFTSEKGTQVSRDPEFKRIVQYYKEHVDRRGMEGTSPDRFLAPTEVFARAGELWMHERDKKAGGHSSFLDTSEHYEESFDYAPLLEIKDDVMRFMDKHFG